MEEIDLREIITIVWNKKSIIIVMVVIFAILGIGYTKFMVEPEYKSTATLALVKNATGDEGKITQTEITLNQKLVATYTELIKSTTVLREVIRNLEYNMDETVLRKNITVGLVSGTQLINISVANANPIMAKELTSEITNVFMKKVEEIYHINNISIVDEAKQPTQPYNINLMKNVVVFIAIGLIFSFGYIILTNLLDTTISGQEEAEKRLQLNVLACIPQYDYDMKKKGKK